MGGAVGKAAEDFAGDASRTRAAARLAVAEHAILQWNRSPGADSGIWDAGASYTNRGLLAAVDEVLLLAEEDPFPACAAAASSSARRRLDGAVAIAMSRMMEEEFLRVRVWNASQSQLRVAVDKLSLASSGASLMVLPSVGDRTSTASTCDASDGSHSRSGSSVPDEAAALMDGQFLDELDLICPAGVFVLHEIALRVVRAGRTKDFFRAFANAPCDVLDRFLSILRVECSRRTTEVVIKRWTLVAKLIGKALVAMRRQLYAQNAGAFDSFRDEYLLAIAENRISVVLKFADGFTGITSHDKLVYMLAMYEALSDAAPGLLLLLSGARKEHVADRTQDILARLADAMRRMVSSLVARIRTSDSPRAPSAADGVHPLARYAMACVELLAPHRTALDLILANGGQDKRGGAPDGGGERVSSFGGLISKLIAGLERNLEEKPALACADAGGSPHLFLANNMSYVLCRAADAGVAASLLGDEWAARHRGRIERHAASYVEASWGPVAACLDHAGGNNGKPTKALARFNAAFNEAHSGQVWREVPDPALRAALRKAISEMVVPAYTAFLQKHPKLGKSVKYTDDDLAQLLSEQFEGEAADS